MAGQSSKRVLILLIVATVTISGTAFADLRKALGRPEILEIGEPTLISPATLRREADRNSDLKEQIELYGWPDYAEIQRTAVVEPLEDYEVRLYYLSREREVVFVHVFVSPGVVDYGIKRYEGPIPPETLGRLLTARMTAPEPVPPPEPLPPPAPVREKNAPAAAPAEAPAGEPEPEAAAPGGEASQPPAGQQASAGGAVVAEPAPVAPAAVAPADAEPDSEPAAAPSGGGMRE